MAVRVHDQKTVGDVRAAGATTPQMNPGFLEQILGQLGSQVEFYTQVSSFQEQPVVKTAPSCPLVPALKAHLRWRLREPNKPLPL
eukprot:1847838-Pyramimonas_sp.AAC.1